MFELDRFIKAQEHDNAYFQALKEIQEGCKQTHWVWYVFPQLRGLGHSYMAERYGLSSILEAKAFLENVILRRRLVDITEALLSHEDKEADAIFGKLDALKVRSCMTLFDLIEPETLWGKILELFYGGQRCRITVNMVNQQIERLENPFSKVHEHTIPLERFFEMDSNYSITGRAVHLFKYALDGESVETILYSFLWLKGLDSQTLTAAAECLTYYLKDYYSRAAFRYARERLADKYNRIALELSILDPITMAKSFDKAVSEIKNDPDAMQALKQYIHAY